MVILFLWQIAACVILYKYIMRGKDASLVIAAKAACYVENAEDFCRISALITIQSSG